MHRRFSPRPTRDSVSELICAGGVVVLRHRRGARVVAAVVALGIGLAVLVTWTAPAGAVAVSDEATFRAAWSNPAETQVDLAADVTLTCSSGSAQRNSATPLTLDGHGHTITANCADHPALVVLSDATGGGSSPVVFRNVIISRGNATQPVTLTSSAVAGGSASGAEPRGVSQVITVEVRKRHHQPRHHGRSRRRPGSIPAVPIPATPVQAVLRFTG